MHLNGFDSIRSTKIDKINNLLKEQFGFVISDNADMKKLSVIKSELSADIARIKLEESSTHTNPDLSKKLLMLEGVKLILEQKLQEFRIVADKNYSVNGKYKKLIDVLTGYVYKHIELGDSKEEALADAMKHYRSSRYRWPDFEVEADVQMRIESLIGIQEADFYYSTDDDMRKAAGDYLDHPSSSGDLSSAELEPMDGDNYDTGQSDFQANMKKAKLNKQKQGQKMRESYVKKIRHLLENEVEQAEVLIAARGFAQELQDMIEKVGRLQNEDLGPVTDQMRDTYGQDTAANFQLSMNSELQGVLDELRGAKDSIDTTVTSLASGESPGSLNDMDGGIDDMGVDDMGVDDLSIDNDVDLDIETDEFGGDDAMAGPELEPLGRATRESKQNLKKKISEMKVRIAKAKSKK